MRPAAFGEQAARPHFWIAFESVGVRMSRVGAE